MNGKNLLELQVRFHEYLWFLTILTSRFDCISCRRGKLFRSSRIWKTIIRDGIKIFMFRNVKAMKLLSHRWVIINETLMDNHQEELAKALKEKHYLEYCLPKVFSTLSRKKCKIITFVIFRTWWRDYPHYWKWNWFNFQKGIHVQLIVN